MTELAIMIQYTGTKAKFLQLYKQRARCFRMAFLAHDLCEIRMRKPTLISLVDWERAQLKCVWMKPEDAIQRLFQRFEEVRTDTALLNALDMARIDIVAVHPLPKSLIPGVPDALTMTGKRRALNIEGTSGCRAPPASATETMPMPAADTATVNPVNLEGHAVTLAADRNGAPLAKGGSRHRDFLRFVFADFHQDASAAVVLSPEVDIVIFNPLGPQQSPAAEVSALRHAIRKTYHEYMRHFERNKDIEEDIAHMEGHIKFLSNKKARLLNRAASKA